MLTDRPHITMDVKQQTATTKLSVGKRLVSVKALCGQRMTCRECLKHKPGRVAQSVGHPTHKSGVLGSIPGLATYFRFSFRFFKKGSCQLLAKVCARSTG